MPADPVKYLGLYPPFLAALRKFEAQLVAAGLDFWLTMGFRSFEQQNGLYAIGRTVPGHIVTNAKGGESWHNFGLAADYACDAHPEKPGLQPTWDMTIPSVRAAYAHYGAVALGCGLEWGGSWERFPDFPHVELSYGLQLRDAQNLYAASGIDAVWAKCGE